MLRVLIADDQPLMRSALRSCLTREPDIEVVAEAANGRQAVDLVYQHSPDVALLDVRMPLVDGVEATRHIVHGTHASATRVIVVTSFDLDEYIFAALRAGASGFLFKDVTPEELVHAVRVVARGDALLTPAVTRRVLERFAPFLPVGPGRRWTGAHPARASGAAAGCQRRDQCPDRRRPARGRKQRQDPRRSPAGQAACPRPGPPGHLRLRERVSCRRPALRPRSQGGAVGRLAPAYPE